MGVKLETDDLHLVAHQVMQLDSILTVPNLGHLVKGARHNLVAKWLVEGHRVDHVLVLGQVQQLLARHRVPNFAGSIIGARDEFVACLVECAIG